jgi:hypothetical protein
MHCWTRRRPWLRPFKNQVSVSKPMIRLRQIGAERPKGIIGDYPSWEKEPNPAYEMGRLWRAPPDNVGIRFDALHV